MQNNTNYDIIVYDNNIERICIMALINCPECNKEVSDKANNCPNCGYPLSDMVTSGDVRIKLPGNIVQGWAGLFSSRSACITDNTEKTLWQGKHGEVAIFTIDTPTNIIIDLGGWANNVEGTVRPKRKYSLVQDMGVHMLATYILSEVDVIDSD